MRHEAPTAPPPPALSPIRDLIDRHPHRIVLVSDDYRKLAATVVTWDDVEGVKFLTEIKRTSSAKD